jgi:hypothetical protein
LYEALGHQRAQRAYLLRQAMKKQCYGCHRHIQIEARGMSIAELKALIIYHNKQCLKNHMRYISLNGVLPETF